MSGNGYGLIDINATILHECGHALFYDCFDGSEFFDILDEQESIYVAEIPSNLSHRYLQEHIVDYLVLINQGDKYQGFSDMDNLRRITKRIDRDSDPLDLLNMLYPFRKELELNVEGLRKINFEQWNIMTWLSKVSGKTRKEIKKLIE